MSTYCVAFVDAMATAGTIMPEFVSRINMDVLHEMLDDIFQNLDTVSKIAFHKPHLKCIRRTGAHSMFS